eukprot:762922-Hanusia_phi.AAC.2
MGMLQFSPSTPCSRRLISPMLQAFLRASQELVARAMPHYSDLGDWTARESPTPFIAAFLSRRGGSAFSPDTAGGYGELDADVSSSPGAQRPPVGVSARSRRSPCDICR